MSRDDGTVFFVAGQGVLTEVNPAKMPEAIAKVEAAMAPASREQCEDWLVMLQAALAGAKRSEAASAITLELYAATLRKFPADIAKRACEALATRPRKGGAWFPSLPELIAECEDQGAERQAMLNALRSWRAPHPATDLEMDSREWLLAAVQAEDEARMCRKSDPDHSSECAEFASLAREMARTLKVEAHHMREAK